MLSFVSQLLEQGVWFDFDHDHELPAQLPVDFERHHALVLDTPAVEALLKDTALHARLDAFAKKGGFVFRLEAASPSDSKSTLDLTTKHRVADIVASANLTQRHPGLRELQLARPVGRMMDELKKSLVSKLAAKGWSEYRLHEWKAALALMEAGHADLREPLADSIRRACGNLPPPAHHDVIAGWFGAAWLAEEFGE